MGGYPVDDSDLGELDAVFSRYVNENAAAWLPSTLRRLPRHPGFFLADIRGRHEDVALVHEEGAYGDRNLVGGYVDEFLWVDRGVRGRGLSAELVLAKHDRVGHLDPISYTTAGRKAHAAAHRLGVARALAEGRKVPDHALADYPDLRASQARGRLTAYLTPAARALAAIAGDMPVANVTAWAVSGLAAGVGAGGLENVVATTGASGADTTGAAGAGAMFSLATGVLGAGTAITGVGRAAASDGRGGGLPFMVFRSVLRTFGSRGAPVPGAGPPRPAERNGADVVGSRAAGVSPDPLLPWDVVSCAPGSFPLSGPV